MLMHREHLVSAMLNIANQRITASGMARFVVGGAGSFRRQVVANDHLKVTHCSLSRSLMLVHHHHASFSVASFVLRKSPPDVRLTLIHIGTKSVVCCCALCVMVRVFRPGCRSHLLAAGSGNPWAKQGSWSPVASRERVFECRTNGGLLLNVITGLCRVLH